MHLTSSVPHSPHLSNLGTIRPWKFVLIWMGKKMPSHYLNSNFPNYNWVYWFIWLVVWVSLLNCLFIFIAYFSILLYCLLTDLVPLPSEPNFSQSDPTFISTPCLSFTLQLSKIQSMTPFSKCSPQGLQWALVSESDEPPPFLPCGHAAQFLTTHSLVSTPSLLDFHLWTLPNTNIAWPRSQVSQTCASPPFLLITHFPSTACLILQQPSVGGLTVVSLYKGWLHDQSSMGIPHPWGFSLARPSLARDIMDTHVHDLLTSLLMEHWPLLSMYPNTCIPLTYSYNTDITTQTDHLWSCPSPALCISVVLLSRYW